MPSQRISRIIAYALSRPAAYLIVALVFLAVVVAIVGQWPAWVILASIGAGVVLLGLLVLDAMSDPNVERDASMADVDTGRIRDASLRRKVRRALEYVRAAQKVTRRDKTGVLDAADDELPQLEQAVRSMFAMSLRLQDFRGDRILQRDFAELQQIRSRRERLSPEQEALWRTLERLQVLVGTAEKEIDRALAQLGSSYAEMQAIKVTPEIRGRVVDSLEQLAASTKRLSDLAQGYDEVYGQRPLPGT